MNEHERIIREKEQAFADDDWERVERLNEEYRSLPPDLDRLMEFYDATTKGDWFLTGMDLVDDDGKPAPYTWVGSDDDVTIAEFDHNPKDDCANASFVVEAHLAFPKLIAELKAWRTGGGNVQP
jgi:hypothetical protein